MPASRAVVVLAPVSAVPDEDGELFLAVYRPRGTWLSRPLGTHDPGEIATSLLLDDGPQLLKELSEWAPQIEPVTFEVVEGRLQLLYTIAVPLSASFLDSKSRLKEPGDYGDDWERLGSLNASTDPLARHTREHWRQNLEETDAVLSLLPKFFTAPQARSLYESLWGKELDPGNFTKWLVKQNRMCREVKDPMSIHDDIDTFAQDRLAHIAGLAGVSLARSLPGNMVGVSPSSIAKSPLGTLTGPVVVGAAAAGLIAYQERRQAGRQPIWYTARREGARRRTLEHLYMPRPTWHEVEAQVAAANP